MHVVLDIDRSKFVNVRETNITREHNLMISKEHFKIDVKIYSYSQRVVKIWNKLPTDWVNATSVKVFKNRIDRYLLKAENVYQYILQTLNKP